MNTILVDTFETSTFPVWEKGQQAMTQDYESLGRYTEAKDQLTTSLMERDKLLRSLEKLAQIAQGMSASSGVVINFRADQAKEILEQLSSIETNIHSLIVEINSNAQKCGKPTVAARDIKN
jgi:hypothetical protein